MIRPSAMVFLTMMIVISGAFAFASQKLIEADGYYIMGDGPAEDMEVAKKDDDAVDMTE